MGIMRKNETIYFQLNQMKTKRDILKIKMRDLK